MRKTTIILCLLLAVMLLPRLSARYAPRYHTMRPAVIHR
jgi:hypothetical protein